MTSALNSPPHPIIMTNPFSTTSDLNPKDGFTQTPSSVAQAANDLRAAASEKAREFAHVAEDTAAQIKQRAVESAGHYKAVATEKAIAFKSSACDKAQQLKGAANDQWNETCTKAKEFQITTEDYIKQNPTKSVLTAVAVGFLVGLIVRR